MVTSGGFQKAKKGSSWLSECTGSFIYVNPLRRVVIAKTSAYVDYNVDGIRMEHEALAAFRAISRTVGVR